MGVEAEHIRRLIRVVRGTRVLVDRDVAALYGVSTGNLNKAVKRNRARFPNDFLFQLTEDEANLIFQSGISSSWGGSRHLPVAFTEQGVAMLSGILRSARAIRVNIAIMRAFVMMRSLAREHGDLAARIDELEKRYEGRFAKVFEELRQVVSEDEPAKRIGFEI